MAKIWFVLDGPDSTIGDPKAELPIEDCVAKLGLDHTQRMRLPAGKTPKFGDQAKRNIHRIAGPKRVVVELREPSAEWQSGFYLLPISPSDASARLGI